jgi:hypothetical protein
MILAEREVRKELEILVQSLQHQIQVLSARGRSYPSAGIEKFPNSPKSEGGGEFSTFEQDDNSDEEGKSSVFQTPNEEKSQFGDGIFGDVNGEVTKTAPRTMSLSQLTLGRGIHQSMNF